MAAFDIRFNDGIIAILTDDYLIAPMITMFLKPGIAFVSIRARPLNQIRIAGHSAVHIDTEHVIFFAVKHRFAAAVQILLVLFFYLVLPVFHLFAIGFHCQQPDYLIPHRIIHF